MLSLIHRTSLRPTKPLVRCYSDSITDLLKSIPNSKKGTDLFRQLQESTLKKQPKQQSYRSKNDNLRSQMPKANQQRSPSHQPPQRNSDPFYKFKPESFKYTESLSLRENEFYTDLFKRVHEVNQHFNVLMLDTGAPKKTHMKNVMKSLAEDETIDLVDVQELKGERYPVVRKMSKEAVLKTFAEKRSVEISKLYGRTKEKKRDANVKFIKVSWEISQTDLENQKKNEITSQLQKGFKLTIAIDSKDNLQDLRGAFEVSASKDVAKLHDLEKLKREKTLEFIKELLLEVADVDISGDIKGKIIMNVSPKVNDNKKADKRVLKDQKKLERIQKQKMKEEQKREKMEARAKEFEQAVAKIS
jgi:hypothetical protein